MLIKIQVSQCGLLYNKFVACVLLLDYRTYSGTCKI